MKNCQVIPIDNA